MHGTVYTRGIKQLSRTSTASLKFLLGYIVKVIPKLRGTDKQEQQQMAQAIKDILSRRN